MQQFKEITQSNVDNLLSLREASALKLDYSFGHKFYYKSGFDRNGVAKKMGWQKDDKIEKVKPVNKPYETLVVGVEDGEEAEFEVYLKKVSDNKVLYIQANSTSVGSFTHVKESGSPPSGAQWEELIVTEFNILNDQANKTPKKVRETYEKFDSYHQDIAKKVATTLDDKVTGNLLIHTGSGGLSVSLSTAWTTEGAKNTTPKTDIINSDKSHRISLKKYGGSRSASPAKAEAVAIVKAGLALAGESDKAWATNLTTNMGNKMETLISTVNATDLKAQYQDGKRTPETENWKKVDDANKELSAELTDIFAKDKKTGGLFARCVLYEASTGATKFGGAKQEAAANQLAKFYMSGKVEYHAMPHHNADIIAKNAEKLKPYVSFKKGGTKSKAYSAFQLALKNEYTPTTATGLILSELNNIEGFSQFLTEDMLEEGVMDVIKRSGQWAKEMGQKAYKAFQKALEAAMKKIWSWLKKIANMGKQFFGKLLEFLGIEIDSVQDKGGISADNFHLLN